MTWFPPTYADWVATQPPLADPVTDEAGIETPVPLPPDRLPEQMKSGVLQVQLDGAWVNAGLVRDVEAVSDSITGGQRWVSGQTVAKWLRQGLISRRALAEVLGAPQTHLDGMVDPGSLEARRAALIEQAKAERNRRANSTAATPLGVVQCDESSRINMTGAAVAAQLAVAAQDAAWSMDWILADNSVVTLNAAQLIAMANAVGNHVRDCFANGELLKAQIAAAADVPTLGAIDITVGWP